MYSKTVIKKSMKNIFVYGGCVSRDVFNKPYNKGELNLVSYIARYSLAKLGSSPVPVKIDPKNLPSAFQRKMVEVDAKNNLLSDLMLKDYDYLLVDFLFTRFPLIQIGSGLLTYSAELRKAKLITSKNRRINTDSIEYWDLLIQGIELLIKTMSAEGCLEKLLINKIYLAEKDSMGVPFENKEAIELQNQFLEKIYKFLSTLIKPSQFLEYEESLLVGALEHQWGRSPMHYIPAFYENCYQKISNL